MPKVTHKPVAGPGVVVYERNGIPWVARQVREFKTKASPMLDVTLDAKGMHPSRIPPGAFIRLRPGVDASDEMIAAAVQKLRTIAKAVRVLPREAVDALLPKLELPTAVNHTARQVVLELGEVAKVTDKAKLIEHLSQVCDEVGL
jgi:hypothetical protein